MNKCSYSDCDLDVWNEYDKCVLHCPKNIYQKDRNNGTLSEFNRKFKQYIIDKLVAEHYCDDEETDTKVVLNGINIGNIESAVDLSKCFFSPTNIIFPERKSRDSFDYLKLLNLFGELCFKDCEFYVSDLKLPNAKVVFLDGTFHTRWSLYDYKLLEKLDYVIYSSCTFKKMVSSYSSEEDSKGMITSSQFNYTCKFNKGLDLSNVDIKKELFNTDVDYIPDDYSIDTLKILNCILNERFRLNNCKIGNFEASNSIFNGKYEFQNNIVEKFSIDNSNFKNLVDFYKTEFIEFKIYKSIFGNFVGFEKCKFGTNTVDNKYITLFEYATFLDFTNFRNTEFLSGLNMEKINLKEYPNFLGSFVEFKNTNRETFRIIKYSYDKIGNHIQANKYFSLEMKKHKVELKDKPLKGFLQEKFIFWVNEKMSNFGQSFLRPIGLIIFFSIIYGLIIYGNEHHWLMNICPKGSELLNTIVHWLNYPLKEFRPLEKILKKDYEFMSLFFNIVFSVLIWQTIVAVKRYTKR